MLKNPTKKAVKKGKQLSTVPLKVVKQIGGKISKTPSRTPSVQKRSTIGAEVEFFILSKNGKITNKADRLIKKIGEQDKKLDVAKETGKNMIELGCYPDMENFNTMQSLADNLETLLYVAESEDSVICPLGTYPGKFTPVTRKTDHYLLHEKVLGKRVYKLSARACGLHVHYALPWGVFDFKKLRLKKRVNSKHKDSLVNSYNFLIAADPGLSAFAQSSPFYQGQLVGKDARALIWRGDKDLKFFTSLHNDVPDHGQLPPYKQTCTDLMNFSQKLYDDWLDKLEEAGVTKDRLPKYTSHLVTNWTPLRISRHGTLEQRGMDINTPLVILATSRIIQNILKMIQEKFVSIEISDRAIDEPFKYEKKKIYIPPFTYVKTELQKRAFFKGFEDEVILKYCKRLLWLAKKLGMKREEAIFEPLEKMLAEKKTVADEIISLAKKLGHKDLKKELPAEIASQIALEYSSRLFKEMVLFRELVKSHTKS